MTMDDLSGLNWTTTNPPESKKPPSQSSASAFAALRPTPPISGRSTPLNGGAFNLPSKPVTPANDSFSNLVSFGPSSSSSSTSKNLSLLEQQKKLIKEKEKQEAAKREQLGAQYRGGDEQFWNTLGSGRNTPQPSTRAEVPDPNRNPSGTLQQPSAPVEDDFLAAFNAKPSISISNHSTRALAKPTSVSPIPPGITDSGLKDLDRFGRSAGSSSFDDDDDPFGLNQLSSTGSAREPGSGTIDEDDVLGLLGRPVSSTTRPKDEPIPRDIPQAESLDEHPQGKALAELVEMGFSPNKARQALENTESGIDVQAAVGWLLTQAHSESRQKAQRRDDSNELIQNHDNRRSEPRRRARSPVEAAPAWSRTDHRPSIDPRRVGTMTPPNAEKDPSQVAAEIGTQFLKTAGSFWKQSTKKVQQVVQEFNSDSDSSQPRWSKEPGTGSPKVVHDDGVDGDGGRRGRKTSTTKKPDLVTDEAMMLESDRARPAPRRPPRPRQESRFNSSADNSRDHSPALPSRLKEQAPSPPEFLRQQQQPPPSQSIRLNRQAIEDQASQAYVSSARRRKPALNPGVSASVPDLLESASQTTAPSRPSSTQPPRPAKFPANAPAKAPTLPTPSVVVRPAASLRSIPPISSIALKASNSNRESGTDSFKKGDYAAAHQSYSSALSHLPQSHPLVIVLLTNRALTSLKIGQPKSAISDADVAISIIGPSRGESETVDFGSGEPGKPMREFYGKALIRKAEALEQMERWTDAAAVWKEAVEGGHGGAASIQGRIRAERAAAPQPVRPKSVPVKRPTKPARSALEDLSGPPATTNASSAAAVNRLRAANAAAEKADDEKFALADAVDAKLTAWRGGKSDNLRALLGSLDTVLWPEAGWKKIGMAELVLPSKVKVQYMKGIAKVHPDKISTTATIEQKMIAGSVFSTLNEAWDKFKAENGL